MKKSIITTLTLLLLTVTFSFSQTIDQLREQVRKAEEEIRLTNEILEKTKKDQTVNNNQLLLVRSNVNNRKSIVSSLDKQISVLNTDIKNKTLSVENLEKEIKELKQEYRDMIYNSYKNYKLNNFMVFLFSSKDFNDMTRRIYYMKRYTSMREQKAVLIDSISQNLFYEIYELELKKISLDSILQNRTAELAKLSQEETNFRNIDTKLRSQTKKYNEELKKKQNDINQLNKRIQQIIEEQAKKTQSSQRTTEEKEVFERLSGKFEQNKGKLPYPVTGGIIIEKFGKHPHPTQKDLSTDKKSVSIAATKGASVRTVFDGVVTSITYLGIWKNIIFVSHGEYMTVYSNIDHCSVKVGDNVTGNQIIGQLSSDDNQDNYVLEFSVTKTEKNGSTTFLNPEQWLKR